EQRAGLVIYCGLGEAGNVGEGRRSAGTVHIGHAGRRVDVEGVPYASELENHPARVALQQGHGPGLAVDGPLGEPAGAVETVAHLHGAPSGDEAHTLWGPDDIAPAGG